MFRDLIGVLAFLDGFIGILCDSFKFFLGSFQFIISSLEILFWDFSLVFFIWFLFLFFLSICLFFKFFEIDWDSLSFWLRFGRYLCNFSMLFLHSLAIDWDSLRFYFLPLVGIDWFFFLVPGYWIFGEIWLRFFQDFPPYFEIICRVFLFIILRFFPIFFYPFTLDSWSISVSFPNIIRYICGSILWKNKRKRENNSQQFYGTSRSFLRYCICVARIGTFLINLKTTKVGEWVGDFLCSFWFFGISFGTVWIGTLFNQFTDIKMREWGRGYSHHGSRFFSGNLAMLLELWFY